MSFKSNMKNVEEAGSGTTKFLMEEREHEFVISEIQEVFTKNGDPMVNVKLVCIGKDDTDCGKWCYDNLVFPNDGSPAIAIKGRSKHFLHCIGEPYDDDGLEINPNRWLHKKVVAEIVTEKPNDYHKFPLSKVHNYVLVEGLNTVPDASMEQSASTDLGDVI